MMFLTAKVDIKKLAIIAVAVVAVIVALVLIFGGSGKKEAFPKNAWLQLLE